LQVARPTRRMSGQIFDRYRPLRVRPSQLDATGWSGQVDWHRTGFHDGIGLHGAKHLPSLRERFSRKKACAEVQPPFGSSRRMIGTARGSHAYLLVTPEKGA